MIQLGGPYSFPSLGTCSWHCWHGNQMILDVVEETRVGGGHVHFPYVVTSLWDGFCYW